jgi:TatD DNase family protein
MALYDPTKTPGNVFDTHTHLNDDSMFHDVAAYVGRAQEFRVMNMNVVGYDNQGNSRALEIAHNFAGEGVRAIIGYQPDDSAQFDEALLRSQLQDDLVVGVGETGLDYFHEGFDKKVQTESFLKHIELAQEFELPLTIHMRDSFDDMYQILKDTGVNNFIMHSFAGDTKQAEKLLELGAYISFSGMITFKNATEIKEAAHIVPLEKMLVETDAPYLAPTPNRGKMNEPAFTKYVVDGLAEVLEMDRDELAKITTQNAVRLFR